MSSFDVGLGFRSEVPIDVLGEHLAVALRPFGLSVMTIEPLDVEVESEVLASSPRAHPFDGPEVFDDYHPGGAAEPEGYAMIIAALQNIAGRRSLGG